MWQYGRIDVKIGCVERNSMGHLSNIRVMYISEHRGIPNRARGLNLKSTSRKRRKQGEIY
jgi:hypothetical protein